MCKLNQWEITEIQSLAEVCDGKSTDNADAGIGAQVTTGSLMCEKDVGTAIVSVTTNVGKTYISELLLGWPEGKPMKLPLNDNMRLPDLSTCFIEVPPNVSETGEQKEEQDNNEKNGTNCILSAIPPVV